MSAANRAPTRRTLVIKATRYEATTSAEGWRNLLGPDADVRVELGGPGATDTYPYVVTANKPSKGGGS